MLQQFSWLQFWISVAMFTGISGSVSVGSGHGVSRLPHRCEKGVESFDGGELLVSDEMIGQPKMPDVLEELMHVFKMLAAQDGSKTDFLLLMKPVREQFAGIGSSPTLLRINAFILVHAPFHLSAQELEDLWD